MVLWPGSQVVRQRSAKPPSRVRFPSRPPNLILFNSVLSKVQYIKKKDIPKVFKAHNVRYGIMILSMTFLIGLMGLFVFPKLSDMYSNMDVQLPPITKIVLKYWVFVFLSLLVLGLKIIFSSPNNIKIDQILSRFADKSDEDLIDLKEIMQHRGPQYDYIIFLLFGAITGLLVLSVILPIYSLTSSL